MKPKPCRIIELKAENVKRLTAVHIRPDGESVIIGGNNNQGKSSVIDSILYALGGERSIPDEPLRRGQKKGEVVVDLGELVVTRRFSDSGGSSLVVRSATGGVIPSPQKILDQLVGKLSFDPLAFTQMDSKAQRECLAKLAGLDFTELNAEYQSIYEQRTEANRCLNQADASLVGKAFVHGLPAAEISATELIGQLSAIQEHNELVRSKHSAADIARQRLINANTISCQQQETVERCRKALREAEAALDAALATESQLSHAANEAKAVADDHEYENDAGIKEQIAQAEETNRKVRANKEFLKLKDARAAAFRKADDLHRQCQATLDRKKDLVTNAKFPLEGLSVSDDAVLFESLPLKQASTSQQIQISTAIGIALNPDLRVMFIREGSLLDLNTLEALNTFAYVHDVQLWIERVSNGDEVSVIIEDGAVAANRLSTSTETAQPKYPI